MSFKPLPAEELVEQRRCCGCGCHNCPYVTEANQRNIAGTTTLHQPFLNFLKSHPKKDWDDFVRFLQSTRT